MQPAGAMGWVSPAQPWQLWNEYRGACTHPRCPTPALSPSLEYPGYFCLSARSRLGHPFLQEAPRLSLVGCSPACFYSLSTHPVLTSLGSPCLSHQEPLKVEGRLDLCRAWHTVGHLLGPGLSSWQNPLRCCSPWESHPFMSTPAASIRTDLWEDISRG